VRAHQTKASLVAGETVQLEHKEATTETIENQPAIFGPALEVPEGFTPSQPLAQVSSGRVAPSFSPLESYPSTPAKSFPIWRVVISGVVVVILASVVFYAVWLEPKHDEQIASTANQTNVETPTPVEPTPLQPTPRASASEQSRRTPSPAKPTPTQLPPEQTKENPSATEPKPTPRNAPVSGGIVNGKATYLVQPPYPPVARSAHASGRVYVQVVIDENGNVISAHATFGHPLLQAAAVNAALASKFTPTTVAGRPVKVNGIIEYYFAAQ
jgi:TonB family protein